MEYLIDGLLLFALLVLSAIFSGVEVAMISLSAAKTRELKEKKVRNARLLCKLKNDPHRLLITILIGNNIVNIGASAYATVLFTNIFGSSGAGIAVGVMTFLVLIFGEITPKTLAHRYKVGVALAMSRPLAMMQFVFYPIIAVLDWLIETLTPDDNPAEKDGDELSEGELKAMITLSVEKGTIDEQESKLIENVLEFSDITVEEVMTPRVKIDALDEEMTIKEAIDFVTEKTHSRIPIYRKTIDTIVGMISVKELLRYMHEGKKTDKKLSEINLSKPINVPYTYKINLLFKRFQKQSNHLAIIRDQHGGVMGLATLEDLLEEIVGDIVDTADNEKEWIIEKKTNMIVIQGGTPVGAIEDYFDEDFPGDDPHNPISCVILEELHRFPTVGEIISFGLFTVKIQKMKDNAIEEVRIELKHSRKKEE